MPKQKKIICHDCNTIFNRKPQNGDKQVCWKCGSKSCTLVTSTEAPTVVSTPTVSTVSTIPTAPSSEGLVLPRSTGSSGGGGITPELLLAQRNKLKKVVKAPIVLPGSKNSATPRGVRVLAMQVKNPLIPKADLALIWRARGSTVDRHAYGESINWNIQSTLTNIAAGLQNTEHSNFGDVYRNLGSELPLRKGPQSKPTMPGVTYYEYGWKASIANWKWSEYVNGVRRPLSTQDNTAANAYLRNVKQGQIFSQRLIIAETGEVFYTPDHYITFWRYHPGTAGWYEYRSAGGSTGPAWDESFYEPELQS